MPPKKKPAAVKAAGVRPRKPYAPPVPADRLDAMIRAVRAHAIASVRTKDAPLSSAVASEIYWTLVRLRYGPPPRHRATDETLKAAALARDMIALFDCPQDQAVQATFPNPRGVDVESLARNYRKLLKVVGVQPLSGFADIPATDRAYRTTEHSKVTGYSTGTQDDK